VLLEDAEERPAGAGVMTWSATAEPSSGRRRLARAIAFTPFRRQSAVDVVQPAPIERDDGADCHQETAASPREAHGVRTEEDEVL